LLGRRIPAVKVISILGCSLGADNDAADDVRISNSGDSFAANFHYQLGTGYERYTEVHARIWDVANVFQKHVGADDFNWTYKDVGRTITLPHGVPSYRLTKSKLRFFWEDGEQKREWAY
jgi:hypothetical protein